MHTNARISYNICWTDDQCFALDTNHSAAANFGSTPNLNLSTIQPLPSPDAVEASPIIQLIPIAKATLE